MSERPIAPGLFSWPAAEPALIGGCCAGCGCIEFPLKASCPKCGADSITPRPLSRRGLLWSWTIQGFPPKSPPYLANPQGFEPFGVGYVELPGEVCVETPLTLADPERLQIGMAMELVIRPVGRDPEGSTLLGFAFAPAGEVA